MRVDAPTCDHCAQPTVPCFASSDTTDPRMLVRVWLCVACNRASPAIGRERQITLQDWEDLKP